MERDQDQGIDVCQYRANMDWSSVQVADYSNVQVFQQRDDTEDELEEGK
jgi:hypothetical protein